MKTFNVLKKDYIMNKKDINFILSCSNKFLDINLNNDFLYSVTINDVLKNSISELDYKLNWKKQDTHTKLWFLTYVLIPINNAKNYQDLFNITYNQLIDIVMRNSIALMFSNTDKKYI